MNIYESGEYVRRYPSSGSSDAPWKAKNIARIILKNDITFDTVVEVGCGSGRILAELERRYQDVSFFGYDISPYLKRLWDECHQSGSKIRFAAEDFLRTDDHFDLLLLIDVFEHIPDYMGFLSAIRKRARYYIFHIPLELSAQGLLRDVPMRARESVGHLHYFSRTTALATLTDCGYVIQDFTLTSAAIDRGQTRRAKLLNILRRPMYKLMPELTVRLFGGWSLLVLAEDDPEKGQGCWDVNI